MKVTLSSCYLLIGNTVIATVCEVCSLPKRSLSSYFFTMPSKEIESCIHDSYDRKVSITDSINFTLLCCHGYCSIEYAGVY